PRGPEERHRRRQPDGAQARDRPGGRGRGGGAQEDQRAHGGQEGDRPGGRHLRQQRQGDRQPDRRGDGEGREGRRDHGGGGQGPRDHAGDGRGHAVRPRLSLPLLRHRPGEDGGGPRGPLHPDPRQEDLHHEGAAPRPREGGAGGQAAPAHRRGRGGRGAGDPGGQQ